MILVAARTARAIPLAVVAASLALLGALLGDTLLAVPLIPSGLPATWLIALASANLLAIAVRPAWGAISLTLRRNPSWWSAQIAFAFLLGVGPYLPVAISHWHAPETTAWLLLLAVAALACAIAPALAWMPITLIGIGIACLNGALGGTLYERFAAHEPGIRLLLLASIVAGVAAIAGRTRRLSWYVS